MPGYTTMREVMVWAQTKKPAKVQMAYWARDGASDTMRSKTVTTNHQRARVAKLIADQVEPGKTYRYHLLIDGQMARTGQKLTFHTQELWQYRKEPPAFTLALGSCAFINQQQYDRSDDGYGRHYDIFDAIATKDPNLMLWLGDNVYYRQVDFYSRTGMMKRYTHTRSSAHLQKLLRSTHHYAIWDDHDFGPNNANGSYIHKERSLRMFKLFWANNDYGVNGLPGITTKFRYNDMAFFLLDNRYHRTPAQLETGQRQILGKQQIDWLINALIGSDAPFKFVVMGGQFLNPAQVYETYANVAPEERERLIGRIEKEGIEGVVFLTGDRHHTELNKMELANGNVIYDLTVSPLTSKPYGKSDQEENPHRVDDTFVGKRNFGLLRFDGPRKKRTMTISIYNHEGEPLWEKTIEAP
jgi:alkaline phosphatase D